MLVMEIANDQLSLEKNSRLRWTNLAISNFLKVIVSTDWVTLKYRFVGGNW